MHIGTILVPCDFSEGAQHAFASALDLAKGWNAKIILFHAIPEFPRIAYANAASPEALSQLEIAKLEAEMLDDADKKLQQFVEHQGDTTVHVDTRVTLSEPFWAICQIAEKESVDLIVMGSHGRTGLAQVLLGSVAERVVRHAACPVLVVRTPRETQHR